MSPLPSMSKSNSRKKPVRIRLPCLLPVSCWFLVGLTFQPRRWSRYFLLIMIELHGVTSQKRELFTVTAVGTSILTLDLNVLMRSSTISFKGRKKREN